MTSKTSKIKVVVTVAVVAVLISGTWILLDRPTSYEEFISNLKLQIWGKEPVNEEIPNALLINHLYGVVGNAVQFTPQLKLLENLWLPHVELEEALASAANEFWAVEIYFGDGTKYNIKTFKPETLEPVENWVVLDIETYARSPIALSNNKLLVVSSDSGDLGDGECRTVYFFDLTAKAPMDSRDLPECQHKLSSLVTTSVGDVYMFYAVGDLLAIRADRYNAQTGDIERIKDMPASLEGVKMDSPRTVEHGGNIFVCDNNNELDIGCAVYYPAGDMWEVVGGFKSDRDSYVLRSVGGRLYAVFGNTLDSSSIEIYNEDEKTWELYMDDIEARYTITWI